MTYTYEIEYTGENNNMYFWKKAIADHQLNDQEMEILKNAACAEETACTVAAEQKVLYQYPPFVLAGVMTTLRERLVWDDPAAYLPATGVKKLVDASFESLVSNLVNDTYVRFITATN